MSVTIDGKPAFVEYISPTQINVQAPSDSAAGRGERGGRSTTARSALPRRRNCRPPRRRSSCTPGRTIAIASRLPDYAAVGDPSAPAMPGRHSWCCGARASARPPRRSRRARWSAARRRGDAPTVTVGGMAVPVISAVLTTGTAGLYQITIQLPANVPTGTVAVQASVGGVQTPAGVTIFVGTP